MRATAPSLILLVLLALAPAALAQQQASESITLNYEDKDIREVIKAIAKFTGKNFLYDDRVRGNVTIISERELGREEAYRVFEAILQVRGFATVLGPGGVIKILPVRDAKAAPLETVTGPGREPNRDLYITRLVSLRYVKVDEIAKTFRPLVSKDAGVIAYAPTNTLILTDTAANIRRLMTIVSEIDVKTHQDQIKVLPVEHASAKDMATHLKEIFGESAPATSPRRPTRAQRGAQQQAGAGVTTSVGAAGQPRFITDERTNSIIVIAPAATIRQVEKLIALLDYKRRGAGRLHVYRLQNADAEEMAGTLSALAGGGAGGAAARAGAGGGAGASQAGATVASLEGGVRITADAPTNSLIIQASAEGFATIREVIEDLDTQRPQVMVEALILEVDIDDQTDLSAGFLYRNLLGAKDGRALAVGAANPAISDPDTLQNIAGGRGNFAAAILGRTIDVVTSESTRVNPFTGETEILTTVTQVPVIQGLLTAAALDSNANIVSAPVLLTADNEEAQITIGENIPILTSRVQTPSSGTGGAFDTSANIERQDVGTTLRVTPQISEGDSVRLEVFQEISTVTSEDPELGPTTSQRTIENTVYVKDQESVMIGGIIDELQIETINKVPWLGDIPVIGWAFRGTSYSIRKTNLILVLTPHIVRDSDDLRKLTIEQREKFRDAAGEKLDWKDDEQEAREKAIQAGISLPRDRNPVRREIEEHTERYPTEEFPRLEQEQKARAEIRERERREVEQRTGGAYGVQMSVFRTADEAATVLESLIELGYDGTLLSRREGDETLHYVQLGPYNTENKAQQVAREVRAASGRGALVVVEP